MSRRILSIILKSEVDDNPDTSWIGEYSNEPGANPVDRQERGDMGWHEYRYFNAALSAEETGNPESVEQDYRRMETLNRGDWCFIGIYAVAEVQLQTRGTIQTIRSPGLWGIESDSGDDYFDEVGKEELASLVSELQAAGFTRAQVKRAIPKELAVEHS